MAFAPSACAPGVKPCLTASAAATRSLLFAGIIRAIWAWRIGGTGTAFGFTAPSGSSLLTITGSGAGATGGAVLTDSGGAGRVIGCAQDPSKATTTIHAGTINAASGRTDGPAKRPMNGSIF